MKFSVIMPAYNSAEYIGRALRSVTGQSCQDFQVVVVDDGSTDDTADIVREYGRTDRRVMLLSHPVSRGPSAARNTAIEHACGEWLALLDSDDEFLPTRLETLSALAEARGLDAIADDLELVEFPGGEPRGLAFDPAWLSTPDPITLSYLLSRDWPGRHRCWSFGTMKPIFRREIVVANGLRYGEDLRLGEDLLFYADLLLAGARFGVTNHHLYRYAVRHGSISASPKPTTQLVEVNKRIRSRLQTSRTAPPDAGELSVMLREREHALWFQLSTWYLRLGLLRQALAASKHMPALFILQQGCDRVLRRFRPR